MAGFLSDSADDGTGGGTSVQSLSFGVQDISGHYTGPFPSSVISTSSYELATQVALPSGLLVPVWLKRNPFSQLIGYGMPELHYFYTLVGQTPQQGMADELVATLPDGQVLYDQISSIAQQVASSSVPVIFQSLTSSSEIVTSADLYWPVYDRTRIAFGHKWVVMFPGVLGLPPQVTSYIRVLQTTVGGQSLDRYEIAGNYVFDSAINRRVPTSYVSDDFMPLTGASQHTVATFDTATNIWSANGIFQASADAQPATITGQLDTNTGLEDRTMTYTWDGATISTSLGFLADRSGSGSVKVDSGSGLPQPLLDLAWGTDGVATATFVGQCSTQCPPATQFVPVFASN